jgi:hypothetical protein
MQEIQRVCAGSYQRQGGNQGHEAPNIHTFTTSAALGSSIREQFKLISYLLRHGPFEIETTGEKRWS